MYSRVDESSQVNEELGGGEAIPLSGRVYFIYVD
jgi:hypothetical protein